MKDREEGGVTLCTSGLYIRSFLRLSPRAP